MQILRRAQRHTLRCGFVTAVMLLQLAGCGRVPLQTEPHKAKKSASGRRTLASKALPTKSEHVKTETLAELARRDPRGLLRRALEHYERKIHDYACIFTRQERVRGKLAKEQVIRVRFRESPYSVQMVWVRNAVRVRRALYVRGRHVDAAGREMFLVEPEGAIVRTVFGTVAIPVHGKRARASSRHTIDQFGFRFALRRILSVNDKAARAGVLDLRYAGEGTIHGRPTFVLQRYLPQGSRIEAFANAYLELHIDQEWLIPLSVRAYADHKATRLNEAYTYSSIKLNCGLGEASFSPCCGKKHR